MDTLSTVWNLRTSGKKSAYPQQFNLLLKKSISGLFTNEVGSRR